MLHWASSQFEKLSLAVAPPPTDPVSRFVFLMQKQSEEEALQCLMEMPDIIHLVVQPTKGSYAIHLACQNSMMKLTQYILAQTNNIHITDATGNTALHYAALSQRMDQAVPVCRLLVAEFGASVLTKNAMGQTPYDVATLTSVRQYLLPIQLQLETQQAIDNGGVGLPPGIDLGGLRIQQNMANIGPPPPTSFGPGVSNGPPPYGVTATPTPTPANVGTPHMFATPNPMSPPPVNHQPPPQQSYLSVAPAPATMPAPSIHQYSADPTSQGSPAMSTPALDNESSLSENPRGYARTGSSSAALDSVARRGKNFVRPDGFHSSSSDVNLQKKYGHVSITKAVPPPPTSGNNSGPLNVSGADAAVAGGPNPFSGGGAVLSGGVHRYAGGSALPHSSRRYPVYDAVSRSATTAPHSAPLAAVAASSMPSFSVFTPGGAVPAASNTSSWSQPQQPMPQHDYAATAQQPYAATPLSGSAPASEWQQQQQQQQQQQRTSWHAEYYSQPNASTWQSNPNLYEETAVGAAPEAEQQPWQVGYDYGASQGVVQPTSTLTMSSPSPLFQTSQVASQQPKPLPVAQEFFAPPPQGAATAQSPEVFFNQVAQESQPSQAADIAGTGEGVPVYSDTSFEPDSNRGAPQYVHSAVESNINAAVPLPSTTESADGETRTNVETWSTTTTTFATSQLQQPRPEPVSLIGTFNAEVRSVSGSSYVAEEFFSAPGAVSSPAVEAVTTPAVPREQPFARAPGSWGISPAIASSLNGGTIAAGDFFSSSPAQQSEPTTPAVQETPAVYPIPAEAAADESLPTTAPAAQMTPTTASNKVSIETSNASQEETAAATNFAISNCGPFSEPNSSAPLNAAALFAKGLSKQTFNDSSANDASHVFDRQVAANPVDTPSLFSQGPSPVAATVQNLFDRPPIIGSSEVPSTVTTSVFDQPPPKLNNTYGLSGLGGAEAFEATAAIKTSAPDLFSNGPPEKILVNTETTPNDDLSEALHNSVIGDDELYDVALSPNSAKKAIALETEAATADSSAATAGTTTPSLNGAESLFAAIGLPPPPFSSSKR